MRISLLLQREPFGRILEQTLAGYWRDRYRQPFELTWGASREGRPSGQAWPGNSYLNFFATAETPGDHFQVIRREFGRSVSAWKRPWQHLYVAAGTSPLSRSLFSQVRFSVSPASPDGGRCLVLGGNHRLRVIDPAAETCTVLLKAGVCPEAITGETSFRRGRRLSFVPELTESRPDRPWFSERFVTGTATTRLPPKLAAEAVRQAAALLAGDVASHDLAFRSAAQLAEQRTHEIVAWVRDKIALPPAMASAVADLAHRFFRVIKESASGDEQTAEAWSHGDFQTGNILSHAGKTWIIDWESVGRRFCGYDLFTLLFASRGPGRLAGKIARFFAETENPERAMLASWPGLEWSPGRRRTLLALYLLEELLYHLKENSDATFFNQAAGLASVLAEISEAAALL